MNTNILKKCIDSLASDKPDLSYVRGLLEALMESNIQPVYIPAQIQNPFIPPVVTSNTIPPIEEGSGLLAQYERGPVAKID